MQMEEAKSINASLSGLRDVISAMKEGSNMKDGSKYIPFRNVKLTHYL